MGNNNDSDKQLVVTLALIQKSLEDIALRVSEHHKTLYGNGNVEDSVLWGIKNLQENSKNIKTEIELLRNELKTPQSVKDNWSDVLKKVAVKSPYILVLIFAIILLHEPTGTLLLSLLKLFGVGG